MSQSPDGNFSVGIISSVIRMNYRRVHDSQILFGCLFGCFSCHMNANAKKMLEKS